MGKTKDDIAKNKKIIISVFIIILLFIGGIFYTVQSNNDHKDSKIEKQETTKKDLTTYIKGLSDLTIEVNAKNIDFLKDITVDKKEIKEITVDSSKVDLTKEGEYNLIYNIIPLDKTSKTMKITKTVKVISAKKAQEEANMGNQVITSNNEIKKEAKEKDTTSKEEPIEKNNSINNNSSNNDYNDRISGNEGNQNNSKSTVNNSDNSSNSNTTITPKSKQPKEPEKTTHVHEFSIYVPAQSHTEYEIVTHTEQIPKYKTIGWYECNDCHEHFKTDDAALDHCVSTCGCGYSYYTDYVQDGYETITTEEKVPKKVIDAPAYYKCECGETHQ